MLQKLEAAHRPPVQEGFSISAPVQEQVNKVEAVQEHRNDAHKQIDGRQEKENGMHISYVCIHMCVCTCMSLCMRMCVYVYVCAHVHVCICVYVCMYTYVCVCMCVWINPCTTKRVFTSQGRYIMLRTRFVIIL